MAQGDPTTTIIGNLVQDAELRFTPNGKAVANFRVASTPRRYDRDQQQYIDGDPTFLTCNIWGNPAENIAQSLHKGDRIIVTGSLKQRTYEAKDGGKRTVYELDAEEVGASMKFATLQTNRTNHGNNNGGSGGQGNNPQQQDPWNTPTTNDAEPPF